MVAFLMLIIVATLLFGAAAVRHTIGQVLLLVGLLAALLTMWTIASQLSGRDWTFLAAATATGAVLLVVWSISFDRKERAGAERRALQQAWHVYDRRGLFAADETVRRRAWALFESGDQRTLKSYCSDEEKRLRAEGYLPETERIDNGLASRIWPPADSSVHKVWFWHKAQIEEQFDEAAQLRARKFFQANDANGLDRFCRLRSSGNAEVTSCVLHRSQHSSQAEDLRP